MNEIIWNVNDQDEYDYDYLLKLTDADFVRSVKRDGSNAQSIKVTNYSLLVQVLIVTSAAVYIHLYQKDEKTKTFSMLTCVDISWIGSVMENVE